MCRWANPLLSPEERFAVGVARELREACAINTSQCRKARYSGSQGVDCLGLTRCQKEHETTQLRASCCGILKTYAVISGYSNLWWNFFGRFVRLEREIGCAAVDLLFQEPLFCPVRSLALPSPTPKVSQDP
jgi:hypothetical protein